MSNYAQEVLKQYKEHGIIIHHSVPENNMKIIGYYHIWLVNYWTEIVEEQLKCLSESGLYAACENIHIGCIGKFSEVKKLEKLIEDYPKIIIEEVSNDNERYEFHTLDIMKRHADNNDDEYYVFYFHTKGISFTKQNNEVAYWGGRYWRQWMNKKVFGEWEKHCANLDLGYETSGIQYRPYREFVNHYSGNFWFANADYIRKLPTVKEINQKDRFQAEFYIGMKSPIAATTSQEFVDYYNPTKQQIDAGEKPQLLPRKRRMNRNIVFTLSYNLVSETERAVKSLYELNDKDDFIHLLVDLDFPLEYGNKIPDDLARSKKRNSERLKNIAAKHGSQYIRIENKGVSQNWSSVAGYMAIHESDIMICCDPDEIVAQSARGWVKAIGTILRGNKEYGVAALTMPDQLEKFNKTNSTERVLNGINVKDVHGAAMWNCLGISCDLVIRMGGIPYPDTHEIYGGLESAIVQRMDEFGLKWCALTDYLCEHTDNVPIYRAYKDDIMFGEFKAEKQIHFDEWLMIQKNNQ